jgi:hypothetical protein
MAYWLLSLLYLGLAFVIVAVELRRSGKLKMDVLGAFILIVALQCVLPGVGIYALLPLSKRGEATGMYVFDRIYTFADATSAYLVFTLTAAFVFFCYVGALTTFRLLEERFGKAAEAPKCELQVSTPGLVGTITLGLIFTAVAFQSMGDNFIQRYANLVLLRSVAIEIEQTALASNALALAQAWSWLTVVALFAVGQIRGRTILWYACFVMLLVFAFFGVSRRAIFLPILFAYLTLVMSDGKWRIGKLVTVGLVVLPVVAFGKEILATISRGGNPDQVEQTYATLVSAGMRTSTDIGITITESLGTISMMDMSPRLGVDHAMSALQRIPDGALGLDFEFPERIVRASTATFADEWTVDIPPGLLGQMWLDFQVFGPLIWGMALGLQIGMLQYLWARLKASRQSAAVLFLLTFIVALPINSGSYDFTFSVDIILVIVVLLFTVRLRRPSDLSAAKSLPSGRNKGASI